MNELRVDEFDYSLPTERIAARPLPQRDASRLLLASEQSARIDHRIVRDLPDVLPSGSLLIMNNSRVVPARLHLKKQTGGAVEVFLLEPEERGTHAEALARSTPHRWRCMIGGKGVQPGTALSGRDPDCTVEALVVARDEGLALIEFSWTSLETFSEILHRFGATPLPPYIKRDDDDEDKERYQTVYARVHGSVAAPTAGLHLSEEVLNRCAEKDVQRCDVTLHIGLGTFEPMRDTSVKNHAMHIEYAAVDKASVVALIEHMQAVESDPEKRTVCIGTTSLRTAESLYHLGRTLHAHPETEPSVLEVSQWCWTETGAAELTAVESLRAVLSYLEKNHLDRIHFATQLMIVPGFPFMICDTLLTNFHQPRSTLLVLVSAFVGHARRAQIYMEALANEYRFLSYGDASLLFRERSGRDRE